MVRTKDSLDQNEATPAVRLAEDKMLRLFLVLISHADFQIAGHQNVEKMLKMSKK
jgi:hypothetical protein